MTTWDAATMMKAILWEETKGKLRALAQAQGQFFDDTIEPRVENRARFDRLTAKVEAFIHDIENEGLHE